MAGPSQDDSLPLACSCGTSGLDPFLEDGFGRIVQAVADEKDTRRCRQEYPFREFGGSGAHGAHAGGYYAFVC
ncbi:MAG: hypothetical protein WCI81_07385 [Chlorobiaceae bacterium]